MGVKKQNYIAIAKRARKRGKPLTFSFSPDKTLYASLKLIPTYSEIIYKVNLI
jgi:hypothetical protein